MLMLEVYLDDSGTHGGPYCFLAGYLTPSERWEDFAREWNPICKECKDRIPARYVVGIEAFRGSTPEIASLTSLVKLTTKEMLRQARDSGARWSTSPPVANAPSTVREFEERTLPEYFNSLLVLAGPAAWVRSPFIEYWDAVAVEHNLSRTG
jgi:hypothetical protein